MRRRRLSTLLLACVAVPAAVIAGCGGSGGGSSDADVGPATAVPANAALYIDGTVKPTGQAADGRQGRAEQGAQHPRPGRQDRLAARGPGEVRRPPDQLPAGRRSLAGREGGLLLHRSRRERAEGRRRDRDEQPGGVPRLRTQGLGSDRDQPRPADLQRRQLPDRTQRPDERLRHGRRLPGDGRPHRLQGRGRRPEGRFARRRQRLQGLARQASQRPARDLLHRSQDPDRRARARRSSASRAERAREERGRIARQAGRPAPSRPRPTASTSSSSGAPTASRRPRARSSADVPGDSWLALGLGNLGDTAKRTLHQLKDSGIPNFEAALSQVESATGASIDQLTGALGDAVLYVRGTTQQTLNGALVVHTNDPELTGRLLSQLQTLVQLGEPGDREAAAARRRWHRLPDQRPDAGSAADRDRAAGRQAGDRVRR